MKKEKKPDSVRVVLIAGAIGGAFPCILRAALVFVGQAPTLVDEINLSYWFGTLLLALLGLGTSWIFNEENLRKAFLLGLGLPSFLQLQLNQNARHLADATIGLPQFATQLYAQEVQHPTLKSIPVPNRSVAVNSKMTRPFDVYFSDSFGKRIATFEWDQQNRMFLVPDKAAYIAFGRDGVAGGKTNLTNNPRAIMGFDINILEKTQYGFLQAFGLPAKIKRSFSVQETRVPTLQPGTQGLIFLGVKTQDGWITPYMEFDEDELVKGSIGRVTYPTVIQSSHVSQDRWPTIVAIGIQLEIVKFVEDSEGNYRAVVTIPHSQHDGAEPR